MKIQIMGKTLETKCRVSPEIENSYENKIVEKRRTISIVNECAFECWRCFFHSILLFFTSVLMPFHSNWDRLFSFSFFAIIFHRIFHSIPANCQMSKQKKEQISKILNFQTAKFESSEIKWRVEYKCTFLVENINFSFAISSWKQKQYFSASDRTKEK